METRVLGALLLALTCVTVNPASSDAALPKVRFSQVRYDSPGDDTGTNVSLNAEWARVTNFGARAEVLTDWTIRDASGHVFKFPTFKLRAGKSVRLHTGSGTNSATDLYWKQDFYVWNNTGDTAVLKNQEGTRIDSCKWGEGLGTITC